MIERLSKKPWLCLPVGWGLFLLVHALLLTASGLMFRAGASSTSSVVSCLWWTTDIVAMFLGFLLVVRGTWSLMKQIENHITRLLLTVVATGVQMALGAFLFVQMVFYIFTLASGAIFC